MTSGRTIDYEALAQEAMRGVVRQVLARTAKAGGLPGEHHFYISFDTQHPGSSLSKRLREKYPEEMTIVLQHRFWDLTVSDDRFEVKLTFDGIPERLVVPFEAIRVFFDPSVRYGLQFEDAEPAREGAPGRPNGLSAARAFLGPGDADRPGGAAARAQRKRPQPRKPRPEAVEPVDPPSAQTGAAAPSEPTEGKSPPPAAAPPPALTPVPSRPDLKPVPAAPALPGAQIVSLSDFRKK
jgi:hypothetical protein